MTAQKFMRDIGTVKNAMKWEYLIVELRLYNSTMEKKLNSIGQEGWKLVTVNRNIFYFIRPIEGIKADLEFKQAYED